MSMVDELSISTQTPLLRKRLSDYHCIIFVSVRWHISPPVLLLFMQEELCDQFWTSCIIRRGLFRLKTGSRGGTWFLNDFRGALLFWATLKITGTLILLIYYCKNFLVLKLRDGLVRDRRLSTKSTDKKSLRQ